MHMPQTGAGARRGRLRWLVTPVLTFVLLGAGAAACGKSDSPGSGTTAPVKLTVGAFGDFGFKPLYEEYKKTHNVEITERIAQYGDHHKNLAASIATNSGAADIEAIEVGFISSFTGQPQRFHNLFDHGAREMKGNFLDWKWDQGLSSDKNTLVGMGTDVGSLAMCYRTDLFAQAGLPTNRDEVSKLWPTWEKYLEVGKQYKAKLPNSGFYESSGNIFRALVGQLPVGVYDDKDNIVVASNPDIKKAFDLTTEMINAKMTAKLAPFTPEWTAGFAQGSFATVACPAWMTAYIEGNAKDASGKWDISAVPGGSGSAGGSFLTAPKQGKNAKEAAELIKFLTAPEQQVKVFKDKGNFPSAPKLYDDPAVRDFSKPYFNNAPMGKIFSDAARALKPQHLGPREGDVMTAIGQGLGRIEDGKQNPQQAWEQVLRDVEKLK